MNSRSGSMCRPAVSPAASVRTPSSTSVSDLDPARPDPQLQSGLERVVLEELPHHAGRVHLVMGPAVTEIIDANEPDFGARGTALITHRRQGPWRVLEHEVRLASV